VKNNIIVIRVIKVSERVEEKLASLEYDPEASAIYVRIKK